MSNTLTNLIPTLYQAIDVVSREMTGFIPAVAVNASAAQAAKDESIRIPVTPSGTAYDIAAGATPADNGDNAISNVEMKISKSRMVPVRWDGEEQLGMSNAGTYNAVLAQQFAQAMRVLVNEVEADLAGLYVGASRATGTAGTAPFASNLSDVANVRKLLADNGAPMTDLQLVIGTEAGAKLRALTNLSYANYNGTDATLRRGTLLDLMGFAVRESAQVKAHSVGTVSGTLTVNKASGYGVGSTAIAWDTATAAAINAGDLITFGSDGNKYVCQACTATPLNINAPGLVKAVADNAAGALSAAYTANMAFDRNALQLICRAPAMPAGGDSSAGVETVTDPVSGITFQIAMYREYRRVKYEVGLAWGVKLIKPEHVALLIG